MVVAGLARTGLLEQLHAALAPQMAGGVAREVALFSAFTVVGSNLVSNVPFMLVARDWTDAFANRELMWLVLATASTFAGNLTLVGSVANLIVAEQAKEVEPIGFLAYLRVGLPVTLLTTAIAVISSSGGRGIRSCGASSPPTRTAPPAPSPRRCSRPPDAPTRRGGRAAWRSAPRGGPA